MPFAKGSLDELKTRFKATAGRRRRFTLGSIARDMELSTETLRKLRKGTANPTVGTVDKLYDWAYRHGIDPPPRFYVPPSPRRTESESAEPGELSSNIFGT